MDGNREGPTAAPQAGEEEDDGRVLAFSRYGTMSDASKRWAKTYRTEIAACSSSLVSTSLTFPLDSMKTRMQAYRFRTFLSCVQHTYRNEQLRGFWRGVWAPLASVTLVRTVSFSIYQRVKYTYDRWIFNATGQSPLVIANTKGALPTLSTVACFGAAGGTVGAMVTFIACPFELTKTSAQISRLMANHGHCKLGNTLQNRGTLRTAQHLVATKGIRGLYQGLHLHMLRDTLGTGIYFMAYESVKQLLATARGNSPTSLLAVMTAGGLCGLVSWAAIYPIDTVKTAYQRNCLAGQANHAPVPRLQYANRNMYRGLTVSMSRSCILNAVFFSVFEAIKKYINGLKVDDYQ